MSAWRPVSLSPGSQSARTTTRYAVSPPSASGSPPRSRTLTQPSQRRTRSGGAGAFASIPVLQPDDVVEMRGRDLEDRRVLDRGDPVHRAGAEVEAGAGCDDLLVERLLAGVAELEAGAATLDVPALVLLPVELQGERLARPHEQDLAYVLVRVGPDQLRAPWLLDPPRLEREPVERAVVRRVEHHATCRCGRQS